MEFRQQASERITRRGRTFSDRADDDPSALNSRGLNDFSPLAMLSDKRRNISIACLNRAELCKHLNSDVNCGPTR
jgi:hypothetical protein